MTNTVVLPTFAVAVTGHRPDKLGGYSRTAAIDAYCVKLVESIQRNYTPPGHELVIFTGMALGFDQGVARACERLGARFVAAIPFPGQESMWPEPSKKEYVRLLTKAYAKHNVSVGGFTPLKMQLRNEWMVNHSQILFALWNGSSGGTRNCVKYAEQKGVRVVHCWRSFARFMESYDLKQLELPHVPVQE